MARRLLDANPLIYHVSLTDLDKAERSAELLTRVEQGAERVLASPLVIFETIFTLHRSLRLPRQQVRDIMLPIIEMRGLDLEDRQLWIAALDLFATKGISFADAFNVAYMRAHGVTEIYSWDTDYDKIEGIVRIEPPALPDDRES